MKITIIGNGAMALSIAQGLPKGFAITVVGRDEQNLKRFCEKTEAKYALLEGYDISSQEVILAVKPHVLEDVASVLKGKAAALYSVLAGTPLKDLQAIDAKRYVRTMPNVAATYNASTTTMTGDAQLRKKAVEIFSHIGRAIWVEDEKQLDIATAIAGSGPAFLALVAEGMSDGAVKCGMKRDLANALVASNFYSFAPLIANEHPAAIKDKISSPAGTTIEGVQSLEKDAVRHSFLQAVLKAYERLQR